MVHLMAKQQHVVAIVLYINVLVSNKVISIAVKFCLRIYKERRMSSEKRNNAIQLVNM